MLFLYSTVFQEARNQVTILCSRKKVRTPTLHDSMDGTGKSILPSEINQAVKGKYRMISPIK